jgi:hypothetical protein
LELLDAFVWDFDVADCLAALLVPVPVPFPVAVPLVGGATFASDTTLLHLAAAFALESFVLNGKYEATPVLSSWTRELIPAK